MSEPLLLRALGTNDGATDVLVVSDVVFAEQLASVSLARLPPPCTRTHARTCATGMDGWVSAAERRQYGGCVYCRTGSTGPARNRDPAHTDARNSLH